jgi:hypothetical protein
MSEISPQQKKDPKRERERERSKDSKEKEVKPQLKSSMFKKREDEIYMLLGEILSKEKKKKGDHKFL